MHRKSTVYIPRNSLHFSAVGSIRHCQPPYISGIIGFFCTLHCQFELQPYSSTANTFFWLNTLFVYLAETGTAASNIPRRNGLDHFCCVGRQISWLCEALYLNYSTKKTILSHFCYCKRQYSHQNYFKLTKWV